jgi:hypothetical protein
MWSSALRGVTERPRVKCPLKASNRVEPSTSSLAPEHYTSRRAALAVFAEQPDVIFRVATSL